MAVIKRYSLADLQRKRAGRPSRTRADAPTHEPDAAFWRHATVRKESGMSKKASARKAALKQRKADARIPPPKKKTV
jgi:hypothetical protein